MQLFDRQGNEMAELGILAFEYTYGVNIASGDFNVDGLLDIASSHDVGQVSVLFNDPTAPGTFPTSTAVAAKIPERIA